MLQLYKSYYMNLRSLTENHGDAHCSKDVFLKLRNRGVTYCGWLRHSSCNQVSSSV